MGQTLSEPVTTKHTESCQNQYLKVGSSSMQGWRINMEDSHTHILALPDDPKAAFFGVYDGHGGNNYFKRIETTNLTCHKKNTLAPVFILKNVDAHYNESRKKKVNG
jgi:hypothetical protein